MTTGATTQTRFTVDELRNEPATISVERASQYLGLSRAFAYQMARDGRLSTLSVGPRRVRVITAALLRDLTAEAR
ncbi:excisionase family DNA-binding protein [Mycobacterium vicinigordonae]|uniref:Excisionase family DNA-binding protein n=1 Tax=Mycobacterium vicinigordonae TaxID=1719132 RepID=A0A7D6EB07_9MYCO|nr:excisionase family DNA-binding protein [Mycobacterium vicinigordonae]QLL08845.1 excisionase family DNA-binding protein [Mycobacterium vicinigordonae]